jgi:predicted ArsR family transcriptional regulator
MAAADVLRCLQGAPQDVAGLAAATGLHPNSVRKQLAILVRRGEVVEETVRTGRVGRPRRVYRAMPAGSPYERLALLLLELRGAGAGGDPVEIGRRAGAAIDAPDALTAVRLTAMAHGLAPVVDGDDVVLTACPFAAAVDIDARTVCDLHLGLARGAAARHGAEVDLVAGAECRFTVRPHPRTLSS